ncbi:MAG: propionyl-CoA synthetase [Rickettsiales bacterium TMED254]|nr:propionyl-CoA synthetase [Rickettsiales bacterium]RPF77304.1 MAG: propionyl-CoA synthetase [Rickettsiales bacterium TMED254]
MSYEKYYLDWKKEPLKFWEKKAENIHWFKKWDNTLHKKNDNTFEWFHGGLLNTCYNCVDRHVKEGKGNKTAIFYDSPVTNIKEKIDYNELLSKVSSLAYALKKEGVNKGDTVIIYMPMIPQVIISMLACARIGVIHSVVFGGFAAEELSSRIDDVAPKLIISSSCGIEPNKIIDYKKILDKAIKLSGHKPLKQIIYQRNTFKCLLNQPGDLDWNNFIDLKKTIDCYPVSSNHPLYILHTSGTTGTPKGIVRTNGGHAVALYNSMKMTYDIDTEDVFWAASDVGWVVGHSYIVYAPLLKGCSTVLYEGKPVGTPDSGQFWRIISEYNVTTMFTAPTAIRAIKKEDPFGKELKKYDLNKLKYIFLAGERADPESIKWSMEMTNKPVIDHWWQTETGWSIAGNFPEFGLFEILHGSTGKAAPGFSVIVLNDNGEEVPAETMGNLVIKLPLPPGCSSSIWNSKNRFHDAYLKKYKGFYNTSDAGVINKDGYISVMSRTDDIINCAGHRISTGSIEEILTVHKDIAECAVIGLKDNLKGEVPIGLIVLNNSLISSEENIIEESIKLVRDKLGPVASYKKTFIVSSLPKTRSGKILRSTISKILNDQTYTIPPTIEDLKVLDYIKKLKNII